ncbi:MAG: metallophosphoesterase family protein [Candidatus Odinarchaeota archaeon]|nr:metallophosphoesterase family protein [Candidatus Odinarchaeota archaeon]
MEYLPFNIWAILVLSLPVLFFIVYNFPWITKYMSIKKFELNLSGNSTLIVSDLHLSESSDPIEEISNFLNEKGIKNLVVAGDFIEYHRETSLDELRSFISMGLKKIGLEKSELKVVYLTSLSSHDPIIRGEKVSIKYEDGPLVIVLRGYSRMFLDGHSFVVLHGDYSVRNGALAGFINFLASILGKKLFLERLLKRILRVENDEWLIMGHTHIPGIDEENKVANCGSWSSHIGREMSKTGILLESEADLTVKVVKF